MTLPRGYSIEVHGGPDSWGRYTFTERYLSDERSYCGTCGHGPRDIRGAWAPCEHYGTDEYRRTGQVFHAPLPADVPDALRVQVAVPVPERRRKRAGPLPT